KVLIGIYLGKSDVTSSFGAAGSLVIMMVWVYYSAQIFLFGAEFTWVYANMYGSRRDEPEQQKAARTEESEVPTRSDTGKIPSDTVPTSSEPAPTAALSLPSRAAPFVDHDHTAQSEPRAGAGMTPSLAARSSAEESHGASTVHAAGLLPRNKRTALGIALATAIVVGIVARFSSVKRLMRARQGAVHRRLAS
ncbi:MAG: hypothetical protein ACXWC3_30575, partial [Burkholderiales bacterium]